jgi:hypothetical protein
MSGQHRAPGPDEIILSAPATGQACSSLEHHRAGRAAQVAVTLSQMGTPGQYRQALWLETWGRSYPLCGPCWEATRHVASSRRPGLLIRDYRSAPARRPAP